MRYYDVIGAIEGDKIKEIISKVSSGKKNSLIRMYRDYYNGIQWRKKGWMTDTTRSGKKVWNIHKKNPNDMGIGEGDLQVYNVCDSTINIYSSYARGTINDSNRIQIDDNEALSNTLNDNINLDLIVSRAITRSGVDSVTILKYKEDQKLEFVDTLQIAPIYNGEDRVGTIRTYAISKNDPMIEANNINLKDKEEQVIFTEIWIPIDEVMWLYKYINEEQLEESGVAPFEFDPHIYINNKDNEFVKFDENNLEISDVGRLIDMQDALNKTTTEEGIIISKVAFPMIKVIKEAYDMMADGTLNAEDFAEKLSEISLVAGKIISAPIETEPGQDIPSGVDSYINNIFSQIYRLTGIPKGVYVSEGMSGISEKTMSAMMESLKRRIDEKRANIEQGMKQYAAMVEGNTDIMDSVHIEWAEMFAMSKEEIAELIIKAFQANILPNGYPLEKILEILGDGERYKELQAVINENDLGKKLDIETERIKANGQRQLIAKDKELSNERQKRVQSEKDALLLSQEMENITSSI